MWPRPCPAGPGPEAPASRSGAGWPAPPGSSRPCRRRPCCWPGRRSARRRRRPRRRRSGRGSRLDGAGRTTDVGGCQDLARLRSRARSRSRRPRRRSPSGPCDGSGAGRAPVALALPAARPEPPAVGGSILGFVAHRCASMDDAVGAAQVGSRMAGRPAPAEGTFRTGSVSRLVGREPDRRRMAKSSRWPSIRRPSHDRGCRPASGSSSSTRSACWRSSGCRFGSSSTWRSRHRSACLACSS